jgi:hypothetical protein
MQSWKTMGASSGTHRRGRTFRKVTSSAVLAASVSAAACLATGPQESKLSQSEERRRHFACDPETGACYVYQGDGNPSSEFVLHIGSGYFTPENGYTYRFSIQVSFGAFTGETVRQVFPGAGDPPPRPYPLTWCEMADSYGQVLYSLGRSSIEQLQLNLTCECLRLNSCTDAITCRAEDPDQPTPIDQQVSAPRCE